MKKNLYYALGYEIYQRIIVYCMSSIIHHDYAPAFSSLSMFCLSFVYAAYLTPDIKKIRMCYLLGLLVLIVMILFSLFSDFSDFAHMWQSPYELMITLIFWLVAVLIIVLPLIITFVSLKLISKVKIFIKKHFFKQDGLIYKCSELIDNDLYYAFNYLVFNTMFLIIFRTIIFTENIQYESSQHAKEYNELSVFWLTFAYAAYFKPNAKKIFLCYLLSLPLIIIDGNMYDKIIDINNQPMFVLSGALIMVSPLIVTWAVSRLVPSSKLILLKTKDFLWKNG